jgi:hypothetical protein
MRCFGWLGKADGVGAVEVALDFVCVWVGSAVVLGAEASFEGRPIEVPGWVEGYVKE